MDELIYILKVVLKRLPYQNFMREGKEAAINISMDILAKEIHKYMANHSDTETGNILESVQSSFEEYEKFFANKKYISGISIFDVIFLLAEKMLVIKNNEILVHYQNILKWRMMAQDLGEEIFVTAFKAAQDLRRGQECRNFDWPIVIGHNNVQLKNLTRKGMAENHFHLWGSAPYFYISWIWMMNHVDIIERGDDFRKIDNNARTMYMFGGEENFENDLKKSCIQAALIRVYLCAILTGQKIAIGRYYIEHRLLFPWIEKIAEIDGKKEILFSNINEIIDYVEEHDKLKKYSYILRNIYAKNVEFSDSIKTEGLEKLLKYSLEKQGKIELIKCRKVFSKDMYYKLWNEGMQKNVAFYLEHYEILISQIDQIQKAIDEMKYTRINVDKVDYMLNYVEENNSSLHNHNHILSGERKFLYEMFRCVKDRKLQERLNVYNWFYVYLRIKEKIRGEMVQSNEWVGFENFSIYQKRSGSFERDKVLEKIKAQMAVASCFEQNVIKLEVRFSPYDTAEKLCKEIRFLDKAIDPHNQFRNNYYYVLHFIKKQDSESKKQNNIYCNFRHANLREEVHRKTIAILELREKYADIAERVLGIDAAAQEIGCRPEVFAQAFRTLHEDTSFNYTEEGYKEIPQLRMTYHVGEDFLDVVDGLRAIDEAVLFLNMDCGDRIGHALALVIDVKKWYKSKNYIISLTKQDYLDNIVWLYHAIIRYDIPRQDNFKDWLETEYRRYFEEIYTRYMDNDYIESIQKRMGKMGHKGNMNFDIHDYYDSWKIRGDNPELYEKGYYYNDHSDRSQYKLHGINRMFPEEFSVRERNEVVILYHFYHYNADVRRAGGIKIDKRIEPTYIEAVKQVQRKMQWEIAQRGIGIETNPSSNFMIGTFSRYDEHPITQFYNEGLTFDQEKLNNSSQIWTSINTDDQGVFDIKLENEYALIARALERKIDENGNPVYSKTMIYNWLDKIRKMGLEQSFLISQMSVYGETSMEKEIQNRENKGYKRLWKN